MVAPQPSDEPTDGPGEEDDRVSAPLMVPGAEFEALMRYAVENGEFPVPPEDHERWIRERVRRHRSPSEGPYEQQHSDGRWTLIAERRTRDGSIAGIRVDITAQKRTELSLHRLATVSSSPELDLDGKIEAILRLGIEHFDLPFALVSVCQGDFLHVRNALPPEDPLLPGTAYPTAGTLCGNALTEGAATLTGAAARDDSPHPPVRALGIRRYLGAAYQVNGVPAGTICFFASEAHADPFPDADLELLRLLAQWVGHEIERQLTMDALERARRELERLATTDELTGLRNRRSLLEFGYAEFDRARRYASHLCVLALDVDFFKRVNDTLGHAGGDRVLQGVASCCQAGIRSVDGVGRLGGEEFILVLVHTGEADGCVVGERIRSSISRIEYGDGLAVTASIGVAERRDSDASFEALLARADAALYAAKQNGRNQVCLATG